MALKLGFLGTGTISQAVVRGICTAAEENASSASITTHKSETQNIEEMVSNLKP